MNYEFQLYTLLDIAIAVALAGLVGLEREVKRKPAGFRTHMIVGGAAALLISLGNTLANSFVGSPVDDYLRTDPIRIMEAIIVGISFIGAGTIIQVKQESKVRYLTSAASVLFSAGIGIAVALKLYVLAVGVTVLILGINMLIGYISQQFFKRKDME